MKIHKYVCEIYDENKELCYIYEDTQVSMLHVWIYKNKYVIYMKIHNKVCDTYEDIQVSMW